MKTDNGQTESIWMATTKNRKPRPLEKNISADVCIVGAGIAGLTTAYLLTQEKKSVVVLDDGPVAGGETCRTTAHLVAALDDRYFDLEKYHGKEKARLAAQSHMAAIGKVEEIVKKEKINCGFERIDGYLFLSPGEPKSLLKDELQATHRMGLKDVEYVDRLPIGSLDFGPALRFPRQGQFHPLKYLDGLAKAIEQDGGHIYTHTHATTFQGGKKAQVRTSAGKTVKTSAIVVATNTPVNDRLVIHAKQSPYRTYVIGVRVPKGSIPHILLWDTGPYSKAPKPVPYHYIRLQELKPDDPDHQKMEVLIVGGEDHKTGQASDMNERFRRLEQWTKKHFPMARDTVFQWSGQVMEPFDGLAFIGRNPLDDDNVFIATGDSGNGMTHGTIAGMLLTDLILGRKNPWTEIYDPSRKPLKALKEFARENFNVAKEYTDLITPGDVDSQKKIKKGSGEVIRQGLKKIAVYRDERNKLHAFSAICPHLGCVVSWNPLEKTWDCPCHGSRYTKEGKVVNGPANTNLPRYPK